MISVKEVLGMASDTTTKEELGTEYGGLPVVEEPQTTSDGTTWPTYPLAWPSGLASATFELSGN